MLDIPSEIIEFVESATATYHSTDANIERIYAAKISQKHLESGSGICLKMEEVPLNSKSPNPDQSAIRFVISDGTYSVECMAHNGSLDARPGGMESETLRQTMMMLTESIRDGSQLMVSGAYQMMGRDKVFVVTDIQKNEEMQSSQMTDEQFTEFMALCEKHGPAFRPLELMVRDDTLWTKLYADLPIKYGVMLFCLSPQKKTDMLHMGIISSMGEGKDHLIEQMIEPLVPCGVASSGKLCTIPGLFGAMSGEDLNSIELGLIPKMNNERIAVSEFQTWNQEVFGELMNVMANGSFTMQKGQVDTKREGKVNFMFLGNPPRDWNPESETKDGRPPKMGMLGAFGEYTPQILSRLTLIFARMTLTDGDTEYAIEDKILDAMNGKYLKKEFNNTLNMWRSFFRQYLKFVSEQDPDITPHRMDIREAMNRIKSMQEFQDAFLDKRTTRDFRKFQEFVNLCKGFARLNGERVVSRMSIEKAERIFTESLNTLIQDGDWKYLKSGATKRMAEVHQRLDDYARTLDRPFADVKEMRNKVPFSDKEWEYMINQGWLVSEEKAIHKATFIDVIPPDMWDDDKS
tara:strand:+ start:1132 stop:2856 length:1725 start_codon:yes stop_codon:yes gene_type:complete